MQQKPGKKQLATEKPRFLVYGPIVKSIDNIIRSATGLDDMMENVLNEIQRLYDCDRIILYYPCDLDAKEWSIQFMKIKQEFADETLLNKKLLEVLS